MKRSKMIYMMSLGMLLFSMKCNAQELSSQNDSTVNAIKIEKLKTRKVAMQKQIAIEDKKRNTVIESVSPETLEKINERQDSICLEFRSELTAVELELKELGADKTSAQIVLQYNNLIHNNQEEPTPNNSTTPAKLSQPDKQVKPTKKK